MSTDEIAAFLKQNGPFMGGGKVGERLYDTANPRVEIEAMGS